MTNQWTKCASVTTGGKPHFWVRRNNTNGDRQWVVWSRQDNQWELKEEQESALTKGFQFVPVVVIATAPTDKALLRL